MIQKGTEKKSHTVKLNCSEKEFARMERRAKKLGKSMEQYVTDCGLAGTERKREKDRRRIRQIVEDTEVSNSIFLLLKEEESKTRDKKLISQIKKLMEGVEKSWQS